MWNNIRPISRGVLPLIAIALVFTACVQQFVYPQDGQRIFSPDGKITIGFELNEGKPVL